MTTSHYKIVCPKCDAVQTQCRCPAPNKDKRFVTCDNCIVGVPKDKTTVVRRDYQNLRDELVQVAAVAVAMVEDLDEGMADTNAISVWGGPWTTRTDRVLAHVAAERGRQDAKWGPQHHYPAEWFVILMEEVGEAAQAALDDVIFPKEQ